MDKKEPDALTEAFSGTREAVLQAIRVNFSYALTQGGYTLTGLSPYFKAAIPDLAWDKSGIHKFLNPDAARDEGKAITLAHIPAAKIIELLRQSIELRDNVQNDFVVAKELMRSARERWGDLADHPPQRQTVLQDIRTNLQYLYDHGGYTYVSLSKVLTDICPDYKWNTSSTRRFVHPTQGDDHHDVNIVFVGPATLGRMLQHSIVLRERVMNGLIGRDLSGPQ